MAKIETVSVNRNGTKVIINACDFDEDRDVLWGGDTPKSLESEYEDLYGKKPHGKMSQESIQKAIDKAKSEGD